MAESGRIKLCAYSVGKETLSCNAVLCLVLFVLEDRANQAKILVYFIFVIQLSLSVNMAREYKCEPVQLSQGQLRDGC